MAWAGLAQPSKRLDVPKDFQGWGTPKPKSFPARLARRKCFIFLEISKLFGPQTPNFSGALRVPASAKDLFDLYNEVFEFVSSNLVRVLPMWAQLLTILTQSGLSIGTYC